MNADNAFVGPDLELPDLELKDSEEEIRQLITDLRDPADDRRRRRSAKPSGSGRSSTTTVWNSNNAPQRRQ